MRIWVPGILLATSLVLAVTTPINPWIIGACTGTLILIVVVADWFLRRRRWKDRRPTLDATDRRADSSRQFPASESG